ncbi:MAG: PIN domain-containing protein [Candidatus Bathyarchaeota archaeon]|nr:PIN domain-containing protein [Candidatus Bathyarchaeota archaeon]
MIVGLDANILCYVLDDAYPEHEVLKNLLLELTPENKVALNPTTIHESYHALVRSQKWLPEKAADALITIINMLNTEFYSQTKKTSTIALNLSARHNLGGRDALIVANYIANQTPTIYTHDKGLLKHQKITYKNTTLTIKDPLQK